MFSIFTLMLVVCILIIFIARLFHIHYFFISQWWCKHWIPYWNQDQHHQLQCLLGPYQSCGNQLCLKHMPTSTQLAAVTSSRCPCFKTDRWFLGDAEDCYIIVNFTLMILLGISRRLEVSCLSKDRLGARVSHLCPHPDVWTLAKQIVFMPIK